jgi:competence protein ComEA
MIKSLLLKLGMLLMTIGVILGFRWTAPPSPPILPTPGKHIVNTHANELAERSGRTSGPSGRTVQGLDSDAAAPAVLSITSIPSRLDLNRASADELASLPGIGTVLAQRVVAFRESVGGFQKIKDLREVKGIGAKKYDRLKSLVTVSTEDTRRETEQRES